MTNSQFSYSQYQSMAAQEQSNSNGDGTKVGYFRLKNDGDIAIARINLSSTDEFSFAAVHTIGANGKWLKVSCLNPLGMNTAGCPLCSAYAANPKGSISKSAKKIFIPMLVSYRDPNAVTGYTAPAPVIWDRPAAFSRELANKLMIAGDLRNTLVLITRNGKAGDMQTTYSMDILPESHPVFKPEMIPSDFSAFTNFNIARHSYWEKTPEEIQAYLTTGQFPERVSNTQQAAVTASTVNYGVSGNATSVAGVAAQTIPQTATTFTQQPAFNLTPNSSDVPNAGIADTVTPPARNFSGFSF